jgi:uncharacterized protein (DUF58 family)
LFLTRRFFTGMIIFIFLFMFAYFIPAIFVVSEILFAFFLSLVIIDYLLLFIPSKALFARRSLADRFSNGDENPVSILIENNYKFKIDIQVIDEIPFQFQRRDVLFPDVIEAGAAKTIHYSIRPTQRGEYDFGKINCYVSSPLGLVRRLFAFDEQKMVAVYPSFINMRKYELMAISNRLTDIGLKKIRKLGQSQEFDQVRHYSTGDDIRTINWKATARRNEFMVNAYQDERAQNIYCLVDKCRVMEMPFAGLSLLDYSINAALVLSKIALLKQDKVGLVTFSRKIDQFVTAQRQTAQIQTILEVLYKQETDFSESDYERLYTAVRSKISQRSLLVLFTNFETVNSMKRQLRILRKVNENHLLMVVIFENTELDAFMNQPAESLKEVYTKSIAEKYKFEKELIVTELKKYGIQTLLTKPEDLTINTINKYIEFKSKNLI